MIYYNIYLCLVLYELMDEELYIDARKHNLEHEVSVVMNLNLR